MTKISPCLPTQYKHDNVSSIPSAIVFHSRERIPRSSRTPSPEKENTADGRRCAKEGGAILQNWMPGRCHMSNACIGVLAGGHSLRWARSSQ